MAYGYWCSGTDDKESVFHLFFRKNPFENAFSIVCGLEEAINYIQEFQFDNDELEYLRHLKGIDNKPLFNEGFIKYLRELKITCDIDAIPEGTVVFPHEPLMRVRGPIIQCQLLETPLLNIINFQTLVATKAARICHAAKGEPVVELGLRRAQGIDGAMTASRAAYIGGCVATSNVLAGKVYNIPVKGTHAHSWVMSFDDEQTAFMTYAKAMPNNSIFLVDTYDTLEGVKKAIIAGQWLRENGHEMVGIRLDSGDLAYLSIEARKLLDEAGFPQAIIVASNDLDEQIIQSLKEQGARINVWGVGTKLVTAYDQPAMGGVYKLGAIRVPPGEWSYKVKLSEQAVKVSNPGIQQVRRFEQDNEFVGDMIFNEEDVKVGLTPRIIDPMDATRFKDFPPACTIEDLLVPIFRTGKLTYAIPPLCDVRERGFTQLSKLHGGIKRFMNPHTYPVGLEPRLHDLKTTLIAQARGKK